MMINSVDVDDVDVDDVNGGETMRRRRRRRRRRRSRISYENELCRWPIGKKTLRSSFPE